MENDNFLDDADYYDDFGFNLEPDCIQKTTQYLPGFLGDYLSQGSAQQRKIKCGLVSCVSVLALIFIIIVLSSAIVLISHLAGSSENSFSSDNPDEEAPSITIPSSFTSSMEEKIIVNNVFVTTVAGYMSVDNHSRNSKIDYTTKEEYGQYTHDSVEYLNSQNMKLINNGICRYYSQHYNNIFSFVPKSEYGGKMNIYGKSLDTYSLGESTNDGGFVEFLLLADGNTPVLLNITLTENMYELKESIHFQDFQEASIDPSIFHTPEECEGEGTICDGGSIETMDMILYSQSNDISLINKNTGDIYGAAGSICDASNSNSLRSADYISLFSVQVNTAWGQYGICYQGFCNGANSYSVGRAAAFRVKEMEGQCSDNSDTGSWFSLVAGAQCSDDQEIGDGTCSWKRLSHKKTITGECLDSHGFQSSCLSDPQLPFSASAKVLQNALDDCENVLVVPAKSHEIGLATKKQNAQNLKTNDGTLTDFLSPFFVLNNFEEKIDE